MAIDLMDVAAEAHKLRCAISGVSFLASDLLGDMHQPDSVDRMESVCALLGLIETKALQVWQLTEQGAQHEPDAQRAAA